jgi:hypothetical protein
LAALPLPGLGVPQYSFETTGRDAKQAPQTRPLAAAANSKAAESQLSFGSIYPVASAGPYIQPFKFEPSAPAWRGEARPDNPSVMRPTKPKLPDNGLNLILLLIYIHP